MKHLIIGAGVSGLCSASQLTMDSIPVIVYDREKAIGGIWNIDNTCGLVNPESRVQVDPVIYRAHGDYRPVVDRKELFDDICQGPEDVLGMCRDMVEKFKIEVVFGREVVGFEVNEDKTVRVRSRDVESMEEREEVFAGLHIRTGSLSKCRDHLFPGQEHFRGVISQGIRGDIPIGDFNGKDVVVIGGGSFTCDNAIRALKGGANKVTLICRSRRSHFPFYSTLKFSRLYSSDMEDPAKVQQMWATSIEVAKKFWKATNMEEFCYNNDTIRRINNNDHMVVKNGTPSSHADVLFLAHYYGLVEFLHDQVDHLTQDTVVTKSGREIQTDFIIKSFGFITDLSLLQPHTIHESIFVDGLSNVTTNIQIDHVVGSKILGPNIPAGAFNLLSYFLLVDIDFIATFFNRNPEKFENFRKNPAYANILIPENVDLCELLKIYTKVFESGEKELLDRIKSSMIERKKMYDKLLPEHEFLKCNKRLWDNTVEVFAAKTGKEKIPYPWNDQLQQSHAC